MSTSPVPILLDTDIGDDVDDAFALLLAARDPRVTLLGVTTVFGDAVQRARIARKLLDLAGRSDVPVSSGRSATLDGWWPGERIVSGQDFATAPHTSGISQGHAVDVLIDTIMTAPAPITLVAIGPLSNIGEALQRQPLLASKIRTLLIMGGRLLDPDHQGEHNLNSDPVATRLVLTSGIPLTIGTYEVTRQAQLSRTDAQRLQASLDPACKAAAAQLLLYLDLLHREATALYDPLTLTCAYTADYLTTQPWSIQASYEERRVLLSGAPEPQSSIRVSTAANASAFHKYLLKTIGAP